MTPTRKKTLITTAVLVLITGIACVLYLNIRQDPPAAFAPAPALPANPYADAAPTGADLPGYLHPAPDNDPGDTPRDDPDRVALPAPPPAPTDPDLPLLAPGVDTTDPAPGDTGANAPARPDQPAHAAPAPDSSAASDRADGDRTAGCPDCTEVEHILLDLGYLNQLLLLLDQIEQNASKLPSALGPVIAHMIRLEHPKLAPLIPATFEADEVKQPLPRADLVALIHAEIGRDATARARAPTPPPVSIGDLRVVYARPGRIDKQTEPRVHVDLRNERITLTPARPLLRGSLHVRLLDILPAAEPRRAHPRVIVKDMKTGKTHTLPWAD